MATRGELTYPANDLAALTHHDSTADPAGPFRGLIVGTAGAIKITLRGGSTVTLPSGALGVGVIHPIRFTRVWSTGTTASNLFGVKEE